MNTDEYTQVLSKINEGVLSNRNKLQKLATCMTSKNFEFIFGGMSNCLKRFQYATFDDSEIGLKKAKKALKTIETADEFLTFEINRRRL